MMELKTIAPVTVACANLRTTLLRIGESAGTVPAMIAQELAKQSISCAGAQIWQYDGCDGVPQTEFALKITIPVNETGTGTDTVQFETLPQFACISTVHRGGWDKLKDVYCEIFAYIGQNGLQINGFTREVYLHCDFENADNCVTEIQIGINQ